MQRLHATIEPAYFSTNFRPMNHLVSVLCAEAKHRQKLVPGVSASQAVESDESGEDTDLDDESDDGVLRVHTLDGKVARVRGLTEHSTVGELRSAVEAQFGAKVDFQRLYIDGSEKTHHARGFGFSTDHSVLELLNDGSIKLGELGVFPARRGETAVASIHLRNREYEALRSQLAVATEVVEEVLERHFDKFNHSVAIAEQMSERYAGLADRVTRSRKLVSEARASLGLRHHNDRLVVQDYNDDDDDGHEAAGVKSALVGGGKFRVLDHWEQVVEADEALSLLAELRDACLSANHVADSTGVYSSTGDGSFRSS